MLSIYIAGILAFWLLPIGSILSGGLFQ